MRPLFVQIKCELGQADAVSDALFDEFDELGELYSTSGPFDLLVKFNLDEDTDISGFITRRLHKIKGIRDTSTLIAFRMHVNPRLNKVG